jgi:hypothetical protein
MTRPISLALVLVLASSLPADPPRTFRAKVTASKARTSAVLRARQEARHREMQWLAEAAEYQEARYAAEQRAFDQWHQRYIADAPVRAAAAQAIAADSYRRASEAQERAEFWHHADPFTHWGEPYYDRWGWGY